MIKKIFLFSLSISFSLLLLEKILPHLSNNTIFANKLWPWQARYTKIDKDRIFRLPSQYRYNPKLINSPLLKVVTLGDSFTSGYLVSDTETYPFYLQEILRTRGVLVNINNAGVPGYGADQEYLLAKKIILEDNPDILIWNINNNDTRDSNRACLLKKKDNSYIQLSALNNLLYMIMKLPIPILDLNITKQTYLFIAKILKMPDDDARYTFGCTKTDGDPEVITDYLKKIIWIDSQLKSLPTLKQTKIIYTYMPIQSYFDPKVSTTDLESGTAYTFEIDYLQKNLKVIDLNQELKKKHVLIQKNNNFYTVTKPSTPLSSLLFLGNEDGGPYGGRHPNPNGYYEIANIIADYLIAKNTSLPLLTTPQVLK